MTKNNGSKSIPNLMIFDLFQNAQPVLVEEILNLTMILKNTGISKFTGYNFKTAGHNIRFFLK